MATHTTRLIAATSALVLTVGLAACGTQAAPPATNSTECITSFDAGKDYFPAKASFDQASGVSVEYHSSYKLVTVKEPLKGSPPESYVLLQCGAPRPELTDEAAKAQIIQIPVKRVTTSSTTQLPAFELLDRIDALVGVESPALVYGDKLRAAIDAGTVKGFGSESGKINVEQLAALQPDLFLSSGIADPAYDKIKSLGVPVAANAEWLESTPLGRAEWLKFTALFLNAEQRASEQFAQIAQHYTAVKDAAAKVGNRPSVVTGAPYKGSWYVAGGQSYVAALVADAGGDYVFKASPGSGNKATDIEVVLAKASGAKVWINATATTRWATTADLVADDPRLASMASVSAGAVWNPTLRVRPGGGNDYWQMGVARPDLILADLVEIFHPGTIADHTSTFYAKLQK